jgi:hypothetical protein
MLVIGINFDYYFTYLYYVWTEPGEIPRFVQGGAFVISCVEFALLYSLKVFVDRYRNMKRRE